MHVKKIILDGFKSYAKRTEVPGFDKEFNAITGLNGTGKSNILDSICFVLGITSLHQVRVTNLQDLIFKSGQAGVTKAIVSIVFDNTNKDQCPPGYENYDELIISRQVEMGGKNKYTINGVTVQSKKVQELFCSVQLNVNNPHFLIMQGRVTKVLNMKPVEILAMIEEAAGLRMYEVKRDSCLKTLKKKDEKLATINAVVNDDIKPKMEKFRKERTLFLELNHTKQYVHDIEQLYKCFLALHCKKNVEIVELKLNGANNNIAEIEGSIENNKVKIEEIDKEIEASADKEQERILKELSEAVKESEKDFSKEAAVEKGLKHTIDAEQRKLTELKENLKTDTKTLEANEKQLSNQKPLYDELVKNNTSAKAAYESCQKQYEALITGMEINDEGQAETLLEQLASARANMTEAATTLKLSKSQLQHRQTQLQAKKKMVNTHKADYESQKKSYNKIQAEISGIEAEMRKMNFSEDHLTELREDRHVLNEDVKGLRDFVHHFTARYPQANFKYSDPEPNFNRSRVLGVVYSLFEADPKHYMALENTAGSRLLNVVVDTSQTSKKLLERGNLKVRTTIIPMDKIQGGSINQKVVDYAKRLVGDENVDSALSLVKYDNRHTAVMKYVFGDVLVCRDINIATKLAFDDKVRRKCVTLEGDVVDPAGVLSGGAAPKEGSLLGKLKDFQNKHSTMQAKLQEIVNFENRIADLSHSSVTWNNYKKKLELKQFELNNQQRALELTKHHEVLKEIQQLEENIEELKKQIETSSELENKNKEKIKDVEEKLKDSEGYKKKQLKKLEAEVKKLKVQSDKTENELKKHAQDFEVLHLDINELKTTIANTEKQIALNEEAIKSMQNDHEAQRGVLAEKKEAIAKLQQEHNNAKAKIAEKNKANQQKCNAKEKLLAQITEFELEIKKKMHNVNKLITEVDKAKAREKEYSKNLSDIDPSYITKAEALSEKEGRHLESKLKSLQEKVKSLSRTINPIAQAMLENEEEKLNDILKKKVIVETDKEVLLKTIAELDKKKLVILENAVAQISKDFGSIFSTLLPGANCTLQAPFGKHITQGIEIKVCLGNIWKESLTELSGGQRSLVALSLILSMLLFKPAPFYILDEIDAALDMSHTQNIGLMIRKHFKQSQFIIVSLKDDMFTNAHVLFKTAFIDGASSVQRVVNQNIRS